MSTTVALLKPFAQAMLNAGVLSMANMSALDDEAAALAARFDALAGKMTKAVFARRFGLPGGASMLSQHLSGNRPLSLDAALAYARGFQVPLDDISARLANEVREASALLADAPAGQPSLNASLLAVLQAIGHLTPGQWGMVRARMDALPGHPEAHEDAAADILPMLARTPGKRQAAG